MKTLRWLVVRGTVFLVSILGFSSMGQSVVPPEAIEQFNQTIGNRVEAVTVLGGDYGSAGGIYSFRGGTLAQLSLTKIGGRGEIASTRPLGWGEIRWAPIGEANLGLTSAENEFTGGYLQGNKISYDLLAFQLGTGARFYFNDHLSLAPGISGIYGYVENEFKPQNNVGEAVKAVASGTFVDWRLDTWSVAPSLEAGYEWTWGRTIFQFRSRYIFFHTESFDSSSPVISIRGDSQTWENKIDADVPLGLKPLGYELHTGGFVSRTELFGGVSAGLKEDYVYTANMRLVLDCLGKIWKVRWVGLGASYIWGEHVGGWTAGIDFRMQF